MKPNTSLTAALFKLKRLQQEIDEAKSAMYNIQLGAFGREFTESEDYNYTEVTLSLETNQQRIKEIIEQL